MKEQLANIANTKEGIDGQNWRRLKRIAVGVFGNNLANVRSE